MPEKAEIWRMADILNGEFIGCVCHYVIIMPKYRRSFGNELYSSMPLNYQLKEGFKQIDFGLKLSRVTSRGKKIIFEFNEKSGPQYRFVSGCGLTGHWMLTQSNNTAIILRFGDRYAFYEETRIGGNFSICAFGSTEYNHIFKDVGPDLSTNEVTWELYYGILKNPKTNNWTIYDFMMEQKFLSGNGNWMTAEILYKCCINPKRLKSYLSDTDIWNLFNWNKKVIFDAYQKGGLTIRDYVDPLGQKGTYEVECYGLSFDKQGNIIIKEENSKGRKMHYCPVVQPW